MSRTAKRILCTLFAVLFLWLILFAADAYRCSRLRRPLFVCPRETADDGGSGLYLGLLYRVELQLNGSLDPAAPPVYTSMTLFGKTIVEAGTPQPEHAPETTDLAAVMVGDVLYYSTGEQVTSQATCGTPDGVIESTVAAGQVPEQNGQSNFGTGYEYQFAPEGELHVLIDGQRIRFVDRAQVCCYPEADR